MSEITLSTGKKIVIREKKGQHHFIERRLLASCMTDGGQNIGGLMSSVTVQNIVSIASIDGKTIDIPKELSGIYEVMDNFSYEEWAEFETKMMPKSVQDKLEEAAKNSQTSPGSEIV